MRCQMTDAHQIRDFMLGGNAHLTLVSKQTGTRYTYRIRNAKIGGEEDPTRKFVSYLRGQDNESDYQYLGMMPEAHLGVLAFRATNASIQLKDSKPFRGFGYLLSRLNQNVVPSDMEIWHEGRCGRCGRKLTVPESIQSGLGPECQKRVGR